MKQCLLSLLVAMVVTIPEFGIAQEPQEVQGNVTEVTLYRGQALITRSIPLGGKAGEQEIVVTGLPEQIASESLFAEGEGLEVRAVRYRTRAVGEEPREEVRKLDGQIKAAQLELARHQQMSKMFQSREQYLTSLEKFVSGTGKSDLEKGTLDAESLQKMTTFVFEQRTLLLDATLKNAQETQATQENIELLQRQRNEVANGNSRTVREALIFLSKEADGDAKLNLNYLVDGAGWSPAYNVRAAQGQENMSVEYHAIINQMTGEDWQNVKLTLSTASPALSSTTPGLAPFRVTLSQPQPQQQGKQGQQQLVEHYAMLNRDLVEAQNANNTVQSLKGYLGNNWRMNEAINKLQYLELSNPSDAYNLLRTSTETQIEGPSIDYNIRNSVSLASRSDQQMVRILELALPAQFYHVATPLLSGYVFREASLKNTSEHDLLGGPVTVYLNSRFVGRSEIPTVARGQEFVVGLGADSQLRVRRELADKKDNIQGGNREVQFTYRLVLENYKNAAVNVRLLDRLPVAKREADINVSLGEMSETLSTDKLYERVEKSKGILRWDLQVPANASGETSQFLTYTYKLAFDRNFSLSTHGDSPDLQQEFERLQNQRFRF